MTQFFPVGRDSAFWGVGQSHTRKLHSAAMAPPLFSSGGN